METKLSLTTHDLGSVTLSNRVVMAPMTRSRAIKNIPNQLMATYYAQRANAGLIITEGVSPSLNGLGYARIPGIFSAEQTAGWKEITQAVHDKGGKNFYATYAHRENWTLRKFTRRGTRFSAIGNPAQRKDVD